MQSDDSPIDVYLSRGQTRQAIEVMLKEIGPATANPAQMAQLALLHLQIDEEKHTRQARELADQAWKLQPDLALVCYTMGCLAMRQHDYPSAITHFQMACQKESWQCSYLAALGEALFLNGDSERALHYARQCLELDNQNQVCHNLYDTILLSISQNTP